MELGGKTAFITGAAQGLGLSIASALHTAGARVVLADISDEVENHANTMNEERNASAVPVHLNVRSVPDFEQVFYESVKKTGGIDIVVNNAGITVMRSIWDIDVDEWDEVLETNLRSIFFACQLAGKHMQERGWGRIINLSSLAGQQPSLVAGAHYAASKAGIISVTKNFAKVLAGDGVTVNTLAPAAIRTPIMDTLPEERIDTLAKNIPVGRVGKPEEVGATCVYLASESSAFLTGATIDVNGGMYMR